MQTRLQNDAEAAALVAGTRLGEELGQKQVIQVLRHMPLDTRSYWAAGFCGALVTLLLQLLSTDQVRLLLETQLTLLRKG